MSRVERFLYMNDGISFISEGPSTMRPREIVNRDDFLLVNSPIRVLKDEPSSLFLAFIFAALQDAAMSRTDIPLDRRTPFTVYADEYQEYTTDTIRQGLTLGRKVRFDLFLSTQNVRSLAKDEDLRQIARKQAGKTRFIGYSGDGAPARLAEMGPIPGAPEDAIALALGFTLAHEEVDTTIVGTRNPEPMVSNIALVEHVLPLAEAVAEELHRRFERVVKR